MGAWSGEPFGNDVAADFGWELDDTKRWTLVRDALDEALASNEPLDADVACVAIAAAEVVAHGVGRPTQSDSYTTSVIAFVTRARRPSRRLVKKALLALDAAVRPEGELAELWAEAGEAEWREANARLTNALSAS